jgi:hypothetical protein
VLKKLLAASVVCLSLVVPSVAAAATLNGETLTGAFPSSRGCHDNGDGTSGAEVTRMPGDAIGPVIGTFIGGFFADWDNATGSVTDVGAGRLTILPADGTAQIPMSIELGSGQGVGTCAADGSWTVNVTGATYVLDDTGETGVVSVSASAVNGAGTVTWVFGPRLPTSADQCQKDGWKSYGAFKNQGDCVSYVATKGKNKPAGS